MSLLLSFQACTPVANSASSSATPHVQLLQRADTVEIRIGGKLITNYWQPAGIKKPVLYPVISPGGQTISRGFPLHPQAGERVDHPHHVGIWFNHGEVQGLDFWNNSTSISPEKQDRYGTILHREFLAVESGDKKGRLKTRSEWVNPGGEVLLEELTTYLFSGDEQVWRVERQTELRAIGDTIEFGDSKEGMFGIRLTGSMEQPSSKPAKVIGPDGDIISSDNTSIAKGRYRNADGLSGDDVWGTRGPWVCLDGEAEGQAVAVAIFDHPENPAAPAYWHARGYGLFSVNNLGRKSYDKSQEEFLLTLPAGESLQFRHQLLVYQGHPDQPTLMRDFQAFESIE